MDEPAGAGALLNAFSEAEPGRKGLVDGVGREVLDAKKERVWGFPTAGGVILDGRVPALPLRAGLFIPVSVNGTRSGKPSWLGDSGISNRGVDVPLVGGPHILPIVPVGVCSSLVRFGNSLCADSCNGDPVLPLETCPSAEALALGPLKGDFEFALFGSVMGDSPDKFRLIEPSALEAGPIVARVV